MKDIEISKDLKDDLEKNQTLLKNAIRNHQITFAKLEHDPDNVNLHKELRKAEAEVLLIGLDQKLILEKLRAEFKAHNKSVSANTCKNGVEERKQNLTASLVRTRKQNIVLKPSPQASFSEESNEESSGYSSPDRCLPINPHDVSQSKFLSYFGLATHETYKEMQNKRVERKRRSTANPHFLYGNKGWDFLPKRKRNNYLASSFSPPNTRQAVKKRNERASPLPISENGNIEHRSSAATSLPSIPHLPSGLTIERVSPSSSPELSSCTMCKQSNGNLLVCEICQNGFHVNCHNRPLPQTPRRCPRCFSKEPVGLLMPAQLPTSQISEFNIQEN
ncbi:hypothetical protein WA026_006388 [Henosepilachna vigintioctopunctata]|uniref:Zinc finger PHD-type domain-containing protein n=1 Tax=Henosepilachna vigintioctopunctata TaxID=420089 RepID=A0AAW1TQF9_9CUCU